MSASDFKFAIVTGTGRCGTQFAAKLLGDSPGVTARHDPDPLNLAFHRYCKWYNLPVDNEGFFRKKEAEVKEDLLHAALSIHSSAHMAFSIEDLFTRFHCKVVIFYRHPAKVVNSYLGKGLYEEKYFISDFGSAIGYQPVGSSPHHFFGRTLPKGEFLGEWMKLSRTGKLGWMWSAVNEEILRQVSLLPSDHVFTCKIEDFDYEKYQFLCGFLGIIPVDETAFTTLSKSKTNRLTTSGQHRVRDWSQQEMDEFVCQVEGIAIKLGYNVDLEAYKEMDLEPNSFEPKNEDSRWQGLKRLFNFRRR